MMMVVAALFVLAFEGIISRGTCVYASVIILHFVLLLLVLFTALEITRAALS